MVEDFTVRTDSDGRKLTKLIRNRCKECYVPGCWEFKNPKDKGQIYLSQKYLAGRKGRKVQIRQLLFRLTYGESPPLATNIHMKCHNKRCVNPAHMAISGWTPPWHVMHRMIDELGWITEEQAIEWYRTPA